MKHQETKLRVSRSLHKRLIEASVEYGVKVPVIFRRMLTKYHRVKAECIAIENVAVYDKTETATKGTVLTLRLPPHLLDGVDAAQLRGMVSDYLDHENNKPKRPAFETDKVAGRDYLEG